MGKTPKKAAPGGDERNLYVRRIKATTAPSKSTESILPERQRESENSNRPKLSNIQKKVHPGSAKKSKLHNAAYSLSQSTKSITKEISKESKVQNTLQHLRIAKQKMQPKLEEAETVSGIISTEKDEKEEIVSDVGNKKEEAPTKDSNTNHLMDEQDPSLNTNTEKKTVECVEEDTASMQNEIKLQDKENDKKENLEENNKKESGEQEQDEMEISLRIEDSPVKSQESASIVNITNDDNELEELPQIQEINDNLKEKKSSQTESEAGTESCSIDIVESVTSELSEVSESPSQQDTNQKERDNFDQNVKSDITGINYDASVTLKDVQIKLNDCLKEKFKHVEVCDNDNNISNISMSDTFGKTLRNISGRSPINRFRHMSSLDYRFSPNDTQLTNVSMLSSPRRETTNVKVVRYSTGLSDIMSSNGSPVERKRKLESPDSITIKKQKIEQNSLLNTSMDLLRGLRKPIQISTPNVSSKVQSDKLNIREINDGNDKYLPTHTDDGTKKWCVIM